MFQSKQKNKENQSTNTASNVQGNALENPFHELKL